MMCVRTQRSCRALSTLVFTKQTLQLSVSSDGACRPWKQREATYVPEELISATRRCGGVPSTYVMVSFEGTSDNE